MKKLFFFLCLLPIHLRAQYVPKYQVGAGEYDCFILNNTTHQVWDVTTGVPSLLPGQPPNVTAVIGGAHSWLLLAAGNLWAAGDNTNGQCGNGVAGGSLALPVQILTDSSGKPFTNIIQAISGGTKLGWGSSALKSDGTVWVWGNTGNGLRANGQWGQNNTRPVQVNFPAGVFITKIQIYQIGLALDSSGNVWTWGGGNEYTSPYNVGQGNANPNYTIPTKISLPGRAVDIAGGSYWNYALLASGSLYGWSYYTSYLGIGNGGFLGYPGNSNTNGKMSPQLLDTSLNLPKPIAHVYVNNEATYVLLTDSTIWGWGDEMCETLGNGVQPNYAALPIPWNWDTGFGELLQQKPVQIGPGLHSFTNLFVSDAWCLYAYAEDVNGQLYSWGRNKSCVLGNGVMEADKAAGNIGSSYPMSWGVPWITAINPFALTSVILSTSPYCLLYPTGAPCNLYTQGSTTPHAIAGAPAVSPGATSTTLNGSASSDAAGTLVYYTWRQLSGPSVAVITLPSSINPTVSNLVAGMYTFLLKVTDNGWKSDSTAVTVVVPAGCPTCPTCPICPPPPVPRFVVKMVTTQTYLNFIWTVVTVLTYNDGTIQTIQ